MKWRVVIEQDPETKEWAAWCPELRGCVSAGSSREQALKNVRDAIRLYLQPSEVPVPDGAEIVEVQVR